MQALPLVPNPLEYGNRASWWIEYPSGLIDLTRTQHLQAGASPPPLNTSAQLDLVVDGNRTVRISKVNSALIVIDMQNYFLNPQLSNAPGGLACVQPVLSILPVLRSQGIKIIWVNWGLTDHELTTIPPSLVRGFESTGWTGSFGSELPYNFGRKLIRGEKNAELYGPLQDEYLQGEKDGTDIWIHKNRLSGMWGPQSALDYYLEENGINTLLFGGVNTDQCVLGTMADAYYRGYDSILISDITATTSPTGAYSSTLYNTFYSYGFVTNSSNILMLGQ